MQVLNNIKKRDKNIERQHNKGSEQQFKAIHFHPHRYRCGKAIRRLLVVVSSSSSPFIVVVAVSLTNVFFFVGFHIIQQHRLKGVATVSTLKYCRVASLKDDVDVVGKKSRAVPLIVIIIITIKSTVGSCDHDAP